ncbi:threonine aldolase family protein [Sporolactobacillus pectinivorans]|uniref:threonine aldolase family protein n=1 Tax=Sporolactobacillus pectinivorans TaxID=1591408 RepID=UPI000C265327|nr:aminotransferase class I/II-fold pyridoxal phosphate-dependent enzyme [Sporolactobacillus pectinivorans]
MSEENDLLKAFRNTGYKLGGNGPRTIQVLNKAFSEVDDATESDFYGNGKLIEDFQKKMADFLGKESAVFFPSGVMAQQIALRIWCDRKGIKTVAYHPTCHLEIHENGGLKELHHIRPLLLADKDRLIQLQDITNLKEDISCLLLELPQREIGGQLPDYGELMRISAYCRENGIRLHLDGARLFEVLPYYQKSAAEICGLFDSVYVSFYKGIGGIAGAILAGDTDFTEESKVWKRRYGGDLISLYPYIISSDYYFDRRIGKMAQYYEEAKEFAGFFNSCHGVLTLPEVPVSNMFHVYINVPEEKLRPLLIDFYQSTDIGLTGYLKKTDNGGCSFETNIGDLYEGVSDDKIRSAFRILDQMLLKVI